MVNEEISPVFPKSGVEQIMNVCTELLEAIRLLNGRVIELEERVKQLEGN